MKSFSPLTPAVFHILLALAPGEKHGYEIMKQVRQDAGGQVKMGNGTLYGSLKRMLAAGLIAEAGDRVDPALDDERRRYYRLTEAGRRALNAEMQRYREVVTLLQERKLKSMKALSSPPTAALRCYAWFIRLYPAPYQRAFGTQMQQTFKDHYADLVAQGRRPGLGFWGAVVADELPAIAGEWLEAGAQAATPERLLGGGIAGLAAVLFGLLAWMLLVAVPTIEPVGEQRLRDLLLAALLCGAYAGVGWWGAGARAGGYPWRAGAAIGGGAGLALVLQILVTDLQAAPVPNFAAPLPALAAVLAGFLGTRATGQVPLGILAGFWCGLVLALVVATGLATTDLLLADRLAQTTWAAQAAGSNGPCLGATGAPLAGYMISDDLGGAAFGLLLWPLVSLLPAGIGGVLGRAGAPVRNAPPAEWRRALAGPALFSTLIAILTVAEGAFRLFF